MTERQKEIVRFKIAQVKKALVADKKHWGGAYHDGHGYRYIQPSLYLQLEDYKGARRYFTWFSKNFPEDPGYPLFLFEWTLTYFKTGDIKGAERKAFETFMSNTYLFDRFLGKELLRFDKFEGPNWEMEETADRLPYNKEMDGLPDFANWLNTFLKSPDFYKSANEFIEIQKQLQTAKGARKRTLLINREKQLLKRFG